MARIKLKWYSISLLTVSFLLLILLVVQYHYNVPCKDEDVDDILTDVCRVYQEGHMAGSMCQSLCDETLLDTKNCLHNGDDGKVVILMQLSNRSVIVKSKHARLADYSMLGYRDFSDKHIFPTVDEFHRLIRNAVYFKLKTTTNVSGVELVRLLWPDEQFSPTSHSTAMMTTIWTLIQQDEYVFVKCMDNYKIMPIIFGSCGHFYVTEYLPRAAFLPIVGDQLSASDWVPRANLAIQLLHLIRSFDYDFHETMHLCDVKLSNFGVSNDGILKAIDVDMTMTNSELTYQFEQKTCSNDADCSFLDCHGWCLSEQNKCERNRINNNLQVLCANILRLMLIQFAPVFVKDKLTSLLQECSSPSAVLHHPECQHALTCQLHITAYQKLGLAFSATVETWHILVDLLTSSVNYYQVLNRP